MPDGPSSDSGLKMEVLKVSAASSLSFGAFWECNDHLSYSSLQPAVFNPPLLYHQAVTALVKNFPKPMVSSMQQILPIVWNTLTESAALYPLDTTTDI